MEYTHPVSGTKIEGLRLGPGTIVIAGDLYDSTDGKWRNAPCVGAEIQPRCYTIIVRPSHLIGQAECWTRSSVDILTHIRTTAPPRGTPSSFI